MVLRLQEILLNYIKAYLLENKLDCSLKKLMKKYKANFTEVDEAINLYKISPNEKTLANLFKVSSGKRRELFTRMNMAPNGTSVIIELREDLLKVLKDNKDLKVH